MRTIKFRGKRIDGGEWEYGFYAEMEGKHVILFKCTDNHTWEGEVDHTTISQFTGLVDKKGNEIYENDVLDVYGNNYRVKYEIGAFMLVRLSSNNDMAETFVDVWNDDAYPLAQAYWNDNGEENCLHIAEIIGNIYDNSGLMELQE